eukprot:6176727-Pleurochrysis_carterae.AAC.3
MLSLVLAGLGFSTVPHCPECHQCPVPNTAVPENSEQLLLREGVIDAIPPEKCRPGGKNVILVVGDGMGWEMIRAGAIAKQVLAEISAAGIDTKTGTEDEQLKATVKAQFAART